jgi:hypothetical protein
MTNKSKTYNFSICFFLGQANFRVASSFFDTVFKGINDIGFTVRIEDEPSGS